MADLPHGRLPVGRPPRHRPDAGDTGCPVPAATAPIARAGAVGRGGSRSAWVPAAGTGTLVVFLATQAARLTIRGPHLRVVDTGPDLVCRRGSVLAEGLGPSRRRSAPRSGQTSPCIGGYSERSEPAATRPQVTAREVRCQIPLLHPLEVTRTADPTARKQRRASGSEIRNGADLPARWPQPGFQGFEPQQRERNRRQPSAEGDREPRARDAGSRWSTFQPWHRAPGCGTSSPPSHRPPSGLRRGGRGGRYGPALVSRLGGVRNSGRPPSRSGAAPQRSPPRSILRQARRDDELDDARQCVEAGRTVHLPDRHPAREGGDLLERPLRAVG
jgi:hypothetical protein